MSIMLILEMNKSDEFNMINSNHGGGIFVKLLLKNG